MLQIIRVAESLGVWEHELERDSVVRYSWHTKAPSSWVHSKPWIKTINQQAAVCVGLNTQNGVVAEVEIYTADLPQTCVTLNSPVQIPEGIPLALGQPVADIKRIEDNAWAIQQGPFHLHLDQEQLFIELYQTPIASCITWDALSFGLDSTSHLVAIQINRVPPEYLLRVAKNLGFVAPT